MKNVLRGSREMVARNVLLVSKVTNVSNALRRFREMVARIAQLVSKVKIVNNALSVSREMVARNVPIVSKVMIVNNVLKGFREMIVRTVLIITMATPVVSFNTISRYLMHYTETYSIIPNEGLHLIELFLNYHRHKDACQLFLSL